MLGHGEPIRVRQGERVLFRLLNASASMGISLALAGHRFTVVALDGNPVPTPATADVLKLDVAERARRHRRDEQPRRLGLRIGRRWRPQHGDGRRRRVPRIAAASRNGLLRRKPIGTTPPSAGAGPLPRRMRPINLKFEKIPGGRGGYNRWTINGKSWPDTNPLFTVQRGRRYRLVMNNNSGDEHPVHMHRHSFEVTKVGDKPTSGVMKDTISMPRYTTAEIDFVADDPGATFFHCHHQDHMDEGFAGLITYA